MVDRGGLENRYTFGYPGFESLSLRHEENFVSATTFEVVAFFMYAYQGACSYGQAYIKKASFKGC